MQKQPIRHMQEQNNSPDLIKVVFLIMAFGTISYIWIRTSKVLAKEIEKGLNNNQ